MKFLPTIDLWAPGMITALHNGQLKLQKGQWVKCGPGPCSRFIRATKRTIYAIHPEGKRGITNERFQMAARCW